MQSYETKGDSMRALAAAKLFPHSDLDIVTGDSNGNLVINHKNQIFMRWMVGSGISCICIHVTMSKGD